MTPLTPATPVPGVRGRGAAADLGEGVTAAPPPLRIQVHGIPAPQGSKRHVGKGRMIEQSTRVRPWRDAVKAAALTQTRGYLAYPVDGPVNVRVIFFFVKPKRAPKTRRVWPITRASGDLDKLLRSTFDALTDAAVWRDDSHVIDVHARKCFADEGVGELTVPGAIIWIWEETL